MEGEAKRRCANKHAYVEAFNKLVRDSTQTELFDEDGKRVAAFHDKEKVWIEDRMNSFDNILDACLVRYSRATLARFDNRIEWPIGKEWRMADWFEAMHPRTCVIPAGTILYHAEKQGRCSDELYDPAPQKDPARPFEPVPGLPFFCALEADRDVCYRATHGYMCVMRTLKTTRDLRLATFDREKSRDEYFSGHESWPCLSHAPGSRDLERILKDWCMTHGFDGWKAICICDQDASPGDDEWWTNSVTSAIMQLVVERANDEMGKHHWWPRVRAHLLMHSAEGFDLEDNQWLMMTTEVGTPPPREALARMTSVLPQPLDRMVALELGSFEICITSPGAQDLVLVK